MAEKLQREGNKDLKDGARGLIPKYTRKLARLIPETSSRTGEKSVATTLSVCD
jgi:hypothetical protein